MTYIYSVVKGRPPHDGQQWHGDDLELKTIKAQDSGRNFDHPPRLPKKHLEDWLQEESARHK